MIFPTLLVKKSNTSDIKVINLSNGDEAAIDQDYFELLISVTKKDSPLACTTQEVKLLASLEECIGLRSIDGSGELAVRTGDFESLGVYLTNDCNLFCRHCYFFEGDKHKQKKEIDFDLLQQAISEAEKMGFYKLKLCGGEPLTYYRIKELLNFLNTRDIMTDVVCNGLLLDQIINDANSSKLSFVVSLDGFEHSHDYLRGNGTYARAKKNIEKAILAGFNTTINMVIYNKNADDIDVFAEMVKDMGVSGLNIQTVRPIGQALARLQNQLITDETFLRKIHQNELEDELEKIQTGQVFDTFHKTGLTIDFNHNVSVYDDKPIGNLDSESLRQIHERSLKENSLPNDFFVNSECVNCDLFMVACAGGCRDRAKRVIGSIYACDYWIPFLLNHPKFKESARSPHEFLLI